MSQTPAAHLGGFMATGLLDVRHDLAALDSGGRWAVLVPFSGQPTLARFAHWESRSPLASAGPWTGPTHWTSSLVDSEYLRAVRGIQARIERGDVYQANLCRILEGELLDPGAMDIAGLHALLHQEHRAPYAGMIRLPEIGIHVATASPELFLRRRGGVVESSPIKGTAPALDQMLEKDRAENIMIVDLVRNDLSRVCRPGSVEVTELLRPDHHPGLVHLVSTVRGHLEHGVGWVELMNATFPPGSVTGAPKFTALQVIDTWETAPRGPYCGAVGWVDSDSGDGELAVAIRTFWREQHEDRHVVRFGTGAGITWASDPLIEWRETELKADLLTRLASSRWPTHSTPVKAGTHARMSTHDAVGT